MPHETCSIVDLARRALELAESGQLTGLALASVYADGSTGSGWSMEAANLAEMLGSITLLSHRLCGEARDKPPRSMLQ